MKTFGPHPALRRTRAVLVTVAASSVATVACTSPRVQPGAAAGLTMDGDTPPSPRGSVAALVADWPAKPREAAAKLTARYGEPDLAGERMLVWYDKGPYVQTVLLRDEQPHNFPMPHTDFLSQTVRYRVPGDKVDELFEYDGSVWVHRTRGELTAQCDMEELNNLALNLAHDIAAGQRTVAEARAFYAKTAMEFKQGDRSSPYLTGLRFQVMQDAADTDRPHQM